MKLIVLCVCMLALAACSQGKASLKVMDVSDYFSSEPEFKEEIFSISGDYKQQFRSYKRAKISWSSYIYAPQMRRVFNLKGFIDFNKVNSIFEEKIYNFTSLSKEQKTWYGRVRELPWPDDFTDPVSAAKMISTKDNHGQLLNLDLLYEDNLPGMTTTVEAYQDLLSLFHYSTILLSDEEILAGKTQLSIHEDKKNKAAIVATIQGETIWKGRPSLKLDIEGLSNVYNRIDDREYEFDITGFMLIDKYTGTTVLLDIVEELPLTRNADFYSRQIMEIDLGSSTPILTDQFAQNREKNL
ncbi:hypothetical protein [Curvivirga aplysinae]|uniref:hypothetical protein n=1 Tax=Curvivirga aplysinae TaxID=2529852 RepID=UPI0012BD120C|nr:hypothetical protein [Curvivirga aplysinae]MTI09093.1 hypothetical protein [Curvivirga aplysinae]